MPRCLDAPLLLFLCLHILGDLAVFLKLRQLSFTLEGNRHLVRPNHFLPLAALAILCLAHLLLCNLG